MQLSLPTERPTVSKPLPEFRSRIAGSVQTLDWREPDERAKACHLLEQHACQGKEGPTDPLLIKHAVSEWPALKVWSLSSFRAKYPEMRVLVRCSPDMRFFYVDPTLLPLWRKLHSLRLRKWLPPTQDAHMSMSDFTERMQEGCQLPNLAYPPTGPEFYYMQSQLAQGMLRDIDLYSPPLSCLGRPGAAGVPGQEDAVLPSGLPIAQVPRLFVSPSGAVSPLHYDTASSFLVQIKGRKRLIFYPPEDLPSLYIHSHYSILRRRSKVDPASPNLRKYPKFGRLKGYQALLEPGDILWFPDQSIRLSTSLSRSIIALNRLAIRSMEECRASPQGNLREEGTSNLTSNGSACRLTGLNEPEEASFQYGDHI